MVIQEISTTKSIQKGYFKNNGKRKQFKISTVIGDRLESELIYGSCDLQLAILEYAAFQFSKKNSDDGYYVSRLESIIKDKKKSKRFTVTYIVRPLEIIDVSDTRKEVIVVDVDIIKN